MLYIITAIVFVSFVYLVCEINYKANRKYRKELIKTIRRENTMSMDVLKNMIIELQTEHVAVPTLTTTLVSSSIGATDGFFKINSYAFSNHYLFGNLVAVDSSLVRNFSMSVDDARHVVPSYLLPIGTHTFQNRPIQDLYPKISKQNNYHELIMDETKYCLQ